MIGECEFAVVIGTAEPAGEPDFGAPRSVIIDSGADNDRVNVHDLVIATDLKVTLGDGDDRVTTRRIDVGRNFIGRAAPIEAYCGSSTTRASAS